MKLIKRGKYLEKIKPYIGKNIIKVLVGQRRVGKSFMLLQLINEVKETDEKANIIFINKELDKFSSISNEKELADYIKKSTIPKKQNYIFIDEIQDIKNFETCLRSLQAENLYDIYCTGSNANLLSGELATYLSGRYIEIKINSLSYLEFIEFHALQNNNESLNKYLRYGGLPYLINLQLEDKVIFDYLKNIYAAILYKDLLARYNIRNVSFLENLIRYLADNIGSIVSAKKISDFLKSQKISISTPAVLNYLNQLSTVFFINKVQRSEIRGKKIFEIGEKYYFEDLGIRNALANFQMDHLHKILENTIYLHLIYRDYKVYVGKDEGKEIDFIGIKDDKKVYIQSCFRLTEKSTIQREFGNLETIKDHYPKMVVSLDEFFTDTNIKGIQHIHLRNFLTEFK